MTNFFEFPHPGYSTTQVIINALGELAANTEHDEHANLKTLLSQSASSRQVPVTSPSTAESMSRLHALGLPSTSEIGLSLLRFGKSAVLQKICVMLLPNASDPRLLYMLAFCEQVRLFACVCGGVIFPHRFLTEF